MPLIYSFIGALSMSIFHLTSGPIILHFMPSQPTSAVVHLHHNFNTKLLQPEPSASQFPRTLLPHGVSGGMRGSSDARPTSSRCPHPLHATGGALADLETHLFTALTSEPHLTALPDITCLQETGSNWVHDNSTWQEAIIQELIALIRKVFLNYL